VKISITNNDHKVDIEIPDDVPGWDCNELAALARDLYRETRPRKAKTTMGFEQPEA
jgi:hypothetical protein